LIAELALVDEASYFDYFRMDKRRFAFLVDAVDHRIRKCDTLMRTNGRHSAILGNWRILQILGISVPN